MDFSVRRKYFLTSVIWSPFLSVSEPSLLYSPCPSLVTVCSISSSSAQCWPACSHWLLPRTWKTRLPSHPHTFLRAPFTSCRVTAGEPSPNSDCGFWIHQLSLPSLLQTPSLGLSTCWQILGSLALRAIASPPCLLAPPNCCSHVIVLLWTVLVQTAQILDSQG